MNQKILNVMQADNVSSCHYVGLLSYEPINLKFYATQD